jgi:hypothetical protein
MARARCPTPRLLARFVQGLSRRQFNHQRPKRGPSKHPNLRQGRRALRKFLLRRLRRLCRQAPRFGEKTPVRCLII